jgi:hypothetical protein
VPVRINFGVKWIDEKLTGHSWLTLDSELYLEPEEKVRQFTSFFSLPLEPEGGGPDEEDLSKLDKMIFD